MHKVILVNPEERIRQQLQETVDWKRHGFEVIGEAGNGREALLLHAELRPDLMVVEISMPEMDGLQVIETIRQTDLECQIIILSSHADFYHAKSAISLGVAAYLLKPADTNEIEKELTRIGIRMQRCFRLYPRESREREMVSLLVAHGEGNLADSLRLFNWPRYRILLVKPNSPEGNSSGLIEIMKRKIVSHLEEREKGLVFIIDSKVGIVLREVGEEFDAVRLFDEIEDALDAVNTPFIAVAGGAVEAITEIGKSYSEAAELLKKEFLYRGERRIIDSNAKIMPQEVPDIGTLSDKLCYAIDIGNRSLLCRVLEEGLLAIAQYDGAEQAIKTVTSQWISLALTKLSKTNEIAYLFVQDALPMTSDIYEQPDYRTLQRLLEDRLMLLLDRIGSDCRDPVIKQVLNFVERHYAENLKLETLGELFHYNSAYLGRLFRNATGDTFRTYLDKVRIRNAKVLLESGLKVHQAASRVGISNVDYFHMKFKKYLGEKPSRYKRKTVSFQGKAAQNE
ncbi:response regulator [Paenibacillus sp. PL91]|uniref:response regulator n=1 Tax=Paenibacillus sp. PL91 TaxID=2729538 RepID=UPI00145F7CDF|nr:response regulator [Paenibacillus sp. PL91]MBC9198738.1 response regulator [Paenibacillus sp. PL91]